MLVGQRHPLVHDRRVDSALFCVAAGIWALVQIHRGPRRVGSNLALGGISLASAVMTLLLMVGLFSHKFGI